MRPHIDRFQIAVTLAVVLQSIILWRTAVKCGWCSLSHDYIIVVRLRNFDVATNIVAADIFLTLLRAPACLVELITRYSY
jgi:hypothetical protein